MTHPPIKAPFELPQTEAAADWYEAGKAAHTAWRASVVDEMQGPEWDALTLTEHLQWMSAAEAACATLSHPAAQAGAVQAARLEGLHGFLLSCAVKANTFLDAATIRDWAKEIASLAATQPSAAPGDGPVAWMDTAGDIISDTRKRLWVDQDGGYRISAQKFTQPLYAAPGAAIAAREQEYDRYPMGDPDEYSEEEPDACEQEPKS